MTDENVTMPGTVRAHSQDDRSLLLDCETATVSVSVLTPRLIRVRVAPSGEFAPRRSWAVATPDADFLPVSFSVDATDAEITLRTDLMHVVVERQSCRIHCTDTSGNVFCADAEPAAWNATEVVCRKQIADGEHFYGFGERTGPLEKRNRQMITWATDSPPDHGDGTDPLYLAIPVCMMVQPEVVYGLFFNNTWNSVFDIGRHHSEIWQFSAYGGEIDYYVAYGPTPADVSQTFGALLGTTPLPPRWALGYHQSRYSYETEAEVRAVAQELRHRDLPCDVIHLDIHYMDGYRVFTWDPERFPDPVQLLADLRNQGFRVVTIIDPGVKVDDNYAVYNGGMKRDAFIREADGEPFVGYVWPDAAVFADFTRPEVRQWWGDQHQALIAQGVSGIWNDMNEPAVFDQPFSEGVEEVGTIDIDAVQGPDDERTVHAEVHNLFGSLMDKATYEGMQRALDGKRAFLLTRSGYAGIQRWAACWMGDNTSWWEHLEMTMPQLANMGLSGVPFTGVDIGGFAGNADGELLTRWMQLGAFLPFCRNHSALYTAHQEPWSFGPEVEAIYRRYLHLRYSLLPYLYSLFWEAQRGTPVLRPLLYHFTDDPVTYTISDQVLCGPSLLLAPVCKPNTDYRHVYLPEGGWYDWWNDEFIEGPAHVLEHAPLDRLPLYARAGAIIPRGPEVQFVDQHPLSELTLEVYPGDGTFTLYEDDGESVAYQSGEFCTTTYSLRQDADQLVLTIGERTGAYTPHQRTIQVRLHGATAQTTVDAEGASYEEATAVLVVAFPDNGQQRTLTFAMG